MIDCESVFRSSTYKTRDAGHQNKNGKLNSKSGNDNPLSLMQQAAAGDERRRGSRI
jgi:hypothetical protein